MKKIIIFSLISVLLGANCLTSNQYNNARAEDFSITIDIDNNALSNPLSLSTWTPNGPSDSFTDDDLSSWRFIAPIIGIGVPTLYQGVKSITNRKPISQKTRVISTADLFAFEYGEEILYNLDFKNSDQTPIYSDTKMYLKITDWLKYSDNSFKLNNKKLTDKKDEDKLTYSKEDAILIVDLNQAKIKNKVSISFGSKILKPDSAKTSPFCLVKFKSESRGTETEWKPLLLPGTEPATNQNPSIK